ncbi:hypothetical protein NQ176_g3199 [Zarea fungicola]|uniref:Uncharacterized protein n=1 Tax=Zarea fungicola TaxID=93591 RepID=A0ACC1NL45_9HYPO|nr:hypothetical protein NQ176_g3199 [Lecanicillium fungicola]
MTSTSAGQISPTTNVGPLPSAMPFDQCNELALSSERIYAVESSTTTYLWLQRNFANWYTLGNSFSTTCLPGNYFDAVSNQLSPVFAPATACPDGYAPMCTLVAIGATIPAAPTVRLWTALATNDAAIGCCPSGYTCADDAGLYSCISTFTPGETSRVILLSNWSSTTDIYANPQTTASVYALKLVYASTQSSTPPPTESTRPSPEPHTASPQPDSHTHAVLSLGQKVAIGIGVPLAVLALLIGLLFVRHRYVKRTAENTQSEYVAADEFRKSELEGSGKSPIELEISGNACDANAASLCQLSKSIGPPGAEMQHVSPHEIAELPGSGPAELSRARNSPTIRRKPVSGSQYSPLSQGFSFMDVESSDQYPNTARDASDRVVSDISFVSGESKTQEDSNMRAIQNSGVNPEINAAHGSELNS